MKAYVYPAIIEPDEGTLMVTFPDIENCFTCGTDYSDAITNAEDALAMMLTDMENNNARIPAPSDPKSVAHTPNQVLALIKADTSAYRRIHSNRAVKKTLTIPAWMAYQADNSGLSLSQVLQSALNERFEAERTRSRE